MSINKPVSIRHLIKSYCLPLHITLFCYAILLSSTATASKTPEVIEVYGQASIKTQFDLLNVNIAIFNQGRSIEKLTAIVNDKTERIIAIAQRYKIEEQDIEISSIKINKIEEDNQSYVQGVEFNNGNYTNRFTNKNTSSKSKHHKNNTSIYINGEAIKNNSRNSSNNEIEQFVVVKSLNINLSYTNQYDSFLTQVIKTGASVYTYNSSSILKSEYTQQALKEAIVDAKNKAENIAKQMGTKLGGIIYLKEIDVPVLSSDPSQRRSDFQIEQPRYAQGLHELPDGIDKMPVSFAAKVRIKYSLVQ